MSQFTKQPQSSQPQASQPQTRKSEADDAPAPWLSVKAGALGSLRVTLREKSIAGIMIFAVLFYGFFYPSAYDSQVASGLNVVVVDEAQTPLSHALTQRVQALQMLDVVQVTPSFSEASAQVSARKADAIFYLSKNFERSVLKGEQGGVALYLSGAYLLRTKTAGNELRSVLSQSIMEAVQPIAEGLGAGRLPIEVQHIALFNEKQGYGSYVVPAVSPLIVQQTLLLGVGMLVSLMLGVQGFRMNTRGFVGVLLTACTIGVLGCFYYFGFVFWFWDYPRGGNLVGMLIATPIYIGSAAALALLLGSFFDKPERPAQMMVCLSVPFFMLSGISWPLAAMPEWLVFLARFIPSTEGIALFVKLNQMGARLDEVAGELLRLLLLFLGYGLAAWWRLVVRHQSANKSSIPA